MPVGPPLEQSGTRWATPIYLHVTLNEEKAAATNLHQTVSTCSSDTLTLSVFCLYIHSDKKDQLNYCACANSYLFSREACEPSKYTDC